MRQEIPQFYSAAPEDKSNTRAPAIPTLHGCVLILRSVYAVIVPQDCPRSARSLLDRSRGYGFTEWGRKGEKCEASIIIGAEFPLSLSGLSRFSVFLSCLTKRCKRRRYTLILRIPARPFFYQFCCIF